MPQFTLLLIDFSIISVNLYEFPEQIDATRGFPVLNTNSKIDITIMSNIIIVVILKYIITAFQIYNFS